MHEGHRSRMIDKVVENVDLLSDHEILEVLLFYAIPRKNVNEIAHKLLDSFGSLKNVLAADAYSLMCVDGVGKSTAAFFVSLSKCFSRVQNEKDKLPEIYSFESCKRQLISAFKNASEEKFLALFLDRNGKIILRKIFSSHSGFMVDINLDELIKGTLVKKPHSIVVCHNHLSGNVTPSFSDDRATEKICISLRLNNIILYDHIIVSDEKFYSYRADGKLESIIKNAELLV